jgi:ABC-2 type transport system ATP-binding protein
MRPGPDGLTVAGMTTSPAILTSGVGNRFGDRTALDGIDLEVPRVSAFGFLGANGAGEATLIRLLLGLAEPTSGSTRLLGRELPATRRSSRRVHQAALRLEPAGDHRPAPG